MNHQDSIFEKAIRGKPLDHIKVIDVHGHLGCGRAFPIYGEGADDIVNVMDRIGIDTVCFSALPGALGTNFAEGNDMVIKAVKKYPHRFSGYILAYPHHDPEQAVREIKRCEDQGLRALKIHDHHKKSYTAREYAASFEYANEKEYPVLAHTWTEEHIKAIRELARTYPRITWILGHSGAEEIEEYIRIALDIEKVFLEICSSKSRHRLIEYFVEKAGPEKILYGSDIPFISAAQQIGRVALAEISEEDKMKILGQNAERIFRPGKRTQKVRS
jgi:predicted TIM-barrel fold metal-dependent hydrolase